MIDRIRPYAKFVAAILTAVLTGVAQFALPIPDSLTRWIQLAVVVAGAVAVYGVRNSEPAGHHAADADDRAS